LHYFLSVIHVPTGHYIGDKINFENKESIQYNNMHIMAILSAADTEEIAYNFENA